MTKHDHDSPSPVAGSRAWWGLVVLVMPTLLVGIDIGALYLALPHLSAELGATSTQQLWIMDVYGFTLAGFLITMGTLGDRIGRRKLLLIGAAAFAVGSLFAAFSTTAEMLIVTRALLGVAGATLMPSTLALIRNIFPNERQTNLAIAAWASCLMGGGALGPVVGGVMVEHFWWGAVFLLGVPLMVVLLVLGPVLLPEYRDPNAGRMDLTSVGLSLAAILPATYGMKELAAGDVAPAMPLGAILLGAICGWLFIRRQLRLEHPLLDLALFANRVFGVTLAALLFSAAALAGSTLLVAQYLQLVLEMGPMESGLWLTPAGIGIAIGSHLGPRLTQWMRPSIAIVGGLAVSIVGFALATVVETSGGLPLVVSAIFLIHLGVGPLFALGVGLVISSAPPEKGGAAASLSETSNNLGSTLGLAIMGTIGAAIYRTQMSAAMPVGLPDTVTEDASESLAGAVASTGSLPGGIGGEILGAARDAGVLGLNVSMVVGGVVFASLAVLMWRTLRHLPKTSAAEPGNP